MKLETKARLTFDSVQFDKNTDAHLVVTLKAPKIDWQAKRSPICIIPVIDVSGSMAGQKLEYAKQSVMKLIDHLQPGDYCGVVTFESGVHVISKPVEMTQRSKDELKAKVGQLHTLGGTNFAGGMMEALEHLNKGDLPAGMLFRIVMFTDGCANEGVATKRPDIVKLLTANLGRSSVSAFGYGSDADQELLADVAKAGNGNYAFIRNPEDALSAFAKELGGLLSTFAQNIVIDVAPHNGHSIESVVSDVTAMEDGNKMVVTLPDILSEEERHIVFAVKLDAQANAFPRESSVFDVKVDFDVLDGAQQKIHCTDEVKAKVKFVKADEAQDKPTPEVDRLVGLAQLVQQQIKAEDYAKAGNYSLAFNALMADEDHFIPRGLGDLAAVASKMAGKMSSHTLYTANSGYLSSAKSGGTRGYGASSMDAEASMDLAALGHALNNHAHNVTAASFGAPSAVPMVGPAPVVPTVVVSPSIIIQQPGHAAPVPTVVFKPVPPPAPQKKSKSKDRSKRW